MNRRLNNHSLIAALLPFAVILSLSACSAQPNSDSGQEGPTKETETTSAAATEQENPDVSDTSEKPAPGNSKDMGTRESGGFDTPEDAVNAYLEGFKSMDLQQMMSAFAIDSYVENYDFKALLDRTTFYSSAQEIGLPNANSLTKDLNIESRKHRISNSILMQYLAFCNSELNLYEPVKLTEDLTPQAFTDQLIRELNANTPKSLKLVGFIPPQELMDTYSSDTNLENMARKAYICGADKIESRAAVFETGDKAYLLCLDTIKYGDRWYIKELNGNIGVLAAISTERSGLVPLDSLEVDWESLVVPYHRGG